MKKRKKQHTYCVYRRIDSFGGGMIVNVISRRSRGRRFDVIEIWIGDGQEKNQIHAFMTPDEAAELAGALMKSVDFWLCRFWPYKKWRRRGSKCRWWGEGLAEVE